MATTENTRTLAVLMATQYAAQDTEITSYWYPAICYEVISTNKSWEQIAVAAKDAYKRHLSPRDFERWEDCVGIAYAAYMNHPSPETLARARAMLKPHFDHYARTLVARWGNFNLAAHDWTDEETEFCSPATQKPELQRCCTDYIAQLRTEMLALYRDSYVQ